MDKSLFRYIWRYSRRDQLIICAVVLASLPFYFASLDLPRRIVNEAIQGRAFEGGRTTAPFLALSFDLPGWLGGGTIVLSEGFPLDRLGLLFGLSGLFLVFVLINGAFKYWINVAKGALGERMLRRMRFDLFALVLRFTPEALRTVKATETATIIKDEVEPIGGFIGDAFITPVFLGTQALTALAFIMVQNVWLGLMAVAVIGIQFTVIPKLRRELLRLGKKRQIASRRLAGRVGEVLDGIEAVHVHNAYAWERAEIGHRLFELFDLRFKIYRRKFSVKFLNNLLAQVTPFLFYAIGGYLALQGSLDIGQLVAVIGAYRELPPPLKELIDWDQQRLDVQVKYDQVVQHFSPERLLPIQEEEAVTGEDEPLVGTLVAKEIQLADSHGGLVLEDVAFMIELPARAALIADGTASASAMARIIGRRTTDFSGTITVGGRDLARLPTQVAGRHLVYAGVDPILFPGSIRDNLMYGLRFRPVEKSEENSREMARRLMEARRTGNPVESIRDHWIDYSMVGARDADDLDRIFLDLLRRVGMQEDIYRFGLSGMIDPDRDPELASRIVEARALLRRTIAAGMADLVEPFDPQRYNDQATVAENLLFGVPTSRELMGRSLAENPAFRDTLDETGTRDDLIAMGLKIAETMTEIFRGLPPGHPLFEQFSFIGADELGEFEAILRRTTTRRGAVEDGPDPTARPAARLCGAAAPPRPSRRSSQETARPHPRGGSRHARAPGGSRGRVLRRGAGLRRGASEGQSPLRPRQLPGRQRPGAGDGGDFGRHCRTRASRGGGTDRSRPPGRTCRAAADRAAARQRQPRALSREAARHSRGRRGAGAVRRRAGQRRCSGSSWSSARGAASSSSCPTTGRPMPSMS